jgi:hypothetical protein
MVLQEVALAIEKSLSAVESAVRKMSKEGVLERVGPKKGGTWVVHTAKKGVLNPGKLTGKSTVN